MSTLLLLAALVSYSIEDIDVICSRQSRFVENTAQARDKGFTKKRMYAGLKRLYSNNIISQSVYLISLQATNFVYQYKKMTPDKLAFIWKDACVDYYMKEK